MIVLAGHCLGLRAGLARAGEGRPWRALSLLPFVVANWAAAASLPSGQEVTALDQTVEVQGDGAAWLVLRYLAPRIARTTGDLSYEAALADMDALCATEGLRLQAEAGPVAQIVIILLDRPVTRGASDPDATQYIAAYAPSAEGCQWI